VQKRLNRSRCSWDVDSGGLKEACIRWGAHWHHLANTTKPSMCGCDAALCQITLTTCFSECSRLLVRSRSVSLVAVCSRWRLLFCSETQRRRSKQRRRWWRRRDVFSAHWSRGPSLQAQMSLLSEGFHQRQRTADSHSLSHRSVYHAAVRASHSLTYWVFFSQPVFSFLPFASLTVDTFASAKLGCVFFSVSAYVLQQDFLLNSWMKIFVTF